MRLVKIWVAALALGLGMGLGGVAVGGEPGPTTKPSTLRASETEGRFIGVKMIGKSFDDKTGDMKVQVANGNKANKEIVSWTGTLTILFRVGREVRGVDIDMGETEQRLAVGEVWVGTITVPHSIDDEEDKRRGRSMVASIVGVKFKVTEVRFADGTVRKVDPKE